MLAPALLALVLTTSPELARARAECERDVRACKLRDALEAAERAAEEAEIEARIAAQERARAEALAAAQAEEAAELEALRRKCGADLNAPRVGMKLTRARECLTGLELVGEDRRGAVYASGGATFRVEGGRITRWLAR